MAEQPIELEIVRSSGRVKTGSARWIVPDTKLLIRLPAALTTDEEKRMVDRLVAKSRAARRRHDLNRAAVLPKRAAELNRLYFGGKLHVASVEWVTNQGRRFGSCTPELLTIRISDRVAAMPAWVLDYVLVHELAHLLEANHSPAFWKLVYRYPLTERARGYLIALGLEGLDGPPADE